MGSVADVFRAALELVDDAVCIVDDTGGIRYQSPAFARLVQRGAAALDVSIEPSLLEAADGEELRLGDAWYRVSQAALEARPGWRVCMAREVTERHDAEEALLVKSGMLQALVDAAPVAILTLDLEKRVTMWNPGAERMFGWTASEVIGRPYPLVPPDQWDKFVTFFDTVIGGQGFTGTEAVRKRKDGQPIVIAISTAPLRDAQGEVVGAMAILEDVTERKALEERFRQAQKMEAVGRLAGGIAHDFNNLLTVILNECASIEVTSDTPGPLRSGLANIQLSAERAAELTRQLLAFGRRQVLQVRSLDLNEVVDGCVAMLRRLIGEDISIRLTLHPQPLVVSADRTQLVRLLMNLAANARDAMPNGGTLWLATDLVAAGAKQWSGGPWARLMVRDSGVGMDTHTLSRVFEPFFTTKGLGTGTGLGLASVYGIVRQSGGEIEVESTEGVGTCFRIYLPRGGAAPRMSPAEGTRVDIRTGRRATILLVEDDEMLRGVVKRSLRREGYDVLHAANAREALVTEAKHPGVIDLLLTDFVMGEMNGRELAEAFLAKRPATPVLFMSGYTDDEIMRRGIATGTAFIHKPFAPSQLVRAIESALAGTVPE